MKNLLFAFLLIPVISHAQDVALSRFHVKPANEQVLKRVSERFEIERRTDGGFHVLVPADKAHVLRDLVPTAELLDHDIALEIQALAVTGYRDLAKAHATIQEFAAKFPKIAQIVPYGKSAKGHNLLALKISDNVTVKENEPEVMITAATHGDELITVEVLLNIMEDMLSNYGKDKRVSDIINGREIYFIPVVNPDGFERQQRYDGGQDPNRSYPYPGNMQNTPTASIKPLIDLFEAHDFKGTLDLHAFGELIMYPWGYTYDPIKTEDEQKFHELTRLMAETNNYTFGPISKVIYVAKGSSADYYYLRKKTTAIAIEMGQSKVPSPAKIPEQTATIKEPVLKFLESF